jgi:hypothetical protein
MEVMVWVGIELMLWVGIEAVVWVGSCAPTWGSAEVANCGLPAASAVTLANTCGCRVAWSSAVLYCQCCRSGWAGLPQVQRSSVVPCAS